SFQWVKYITHHGSLSDSASCRPWSYMARAMDGSLLWWELASRAVSSSRRRSGSPSTLAWYSSNQEKTLMPPTLRGPGDVLRDCPTNPLYRTGTGASLSFVDNHGCRAVRLARRPAAPYNNATFHGKRGDPEESAMADNGKAALSVREEMLARLG